MHTDENKKFDKRNVRKNIHEGIISQKDYEVYLTKLPDVSEKLFNPEELLEDPENSFSKKEEEIQSKKKEIKKKNKIKGK
jgi:hypothetical protein